MNKKDINKIKKFCKLHLIPLEEIKSNHQTKNISKNRRFLSVLLTDVNNWASSKVGIIVNRKKSTIRRNTMLHKGFCKYNKVYQKEYNELREKWVVIKVSKSDKVLNNQKPVTLTDMKTMEKHEFISIGRAAAHLKCSGPLLKHYKDRNITKFLGYEIEYK